MPAIISDYSPIYRGDTKKPFVVQFLHKDGTPEPLTDVTLEMTMINAHNGHVKEQAGTWTIIDASDGVASYQRDPSEVDTAGTWRQWIKIIDIVDVPEGEEAPPVSYEHADPLVLEIKEIE